MNHKYFITFTALEVFFLYRTAFPRQRKTFRILGKHFSDGGTLSESSGSTFPTEILLPTKKLL